MSLPSHPGDVRMCPTTSSSGNYPHQSAMQSQVQQRCQTVIHQRNEITAGISQGQRVPQEGVGQSWEQQSCQAAVHGTAKAQDQDIFQCLGEKQMHNLCAEHGPEWATEPSEAHSTAVPIPIPSL